MWPGNGTTHVFRSESQEPRMQASKLVASVGVAALVALAIGCTSNNLSPTLPTDLSSSAVANSDGSTLKVSAPSPTSPADNTTFDQGTYSATLTASTATPQYSTSATL